MYMLYASTCPATLKCFFLPEVRFGLDLWHEMQSLVFSPEGQWYIVYFIWDEAQKLLKTKIAITASYREGRYDQSVLTDTLLLSKVLRDKGDLSEARLYGRRAYKSFKKQKPSNRENCIAALENLIQISDLGSQPRDADAYRAVLDHHYLSRPEVRSSSAGVTGVENTNKARVDDPFSDLGFDDSTITLGSSQSPSSMREGYKPADPPHDWDTVFKTVDKDLSGTPPTDVKSIESSAKTDVGEMLNGLDFDDNTIDLDSSRFQPETQPQIQRDLSGTRRRTMNSGADSAIDDPEASRREPVSTRYPQSPTLRQAPSQPQQSPHEHAEEEENILVGGEEEENIPAQNTQQAYEITLVQAGETIENGGKRIVAIAIHPASTLIAVATDNGDIKIWDRYTLGALPIAKIKHKLVIGISVPATFLAFSPDGNYLATASNDDLVVMLWNVTTWKVAHKINDLWFDVQSLAFSTTGSHLAFSDRRRIIIWDVKKATRLHTVAIKMAKSMVFAAARHNPRSLSDGLLAATVSEIYLIRNGSYTRIWSFLANTEIGIISIAVSPDSSMMACLKLCRPMLSNNRIELYRGVLVFDLLESPALQQSRLKNWREDITGSGSLLADSKRGDLAFSPKFHGLIVANIRDEGVVEFHPLDSKGSEKTTTKISAKLDTKSTMTRLVVASDGTLVTTHDDGSIRCYTQPDGIFAGTPSSSEHDDPILKQLCGMGYPRDLAQTALEKVDYNIQRAAEYLDTLLK
ncbi:WD40 repeat-like protein [Microthyrium microscopicum]|uniref:Mitochondrial division protein 1 n=1 Tax=Microthyrium microscopicum TaxID=703497 RepID=A0A6A6UKH9_9PEZI|nr:WD40 repeat-like protein [Microthyrium microscopicum]